MGVAAYHVYDLEGNFVNSIIWDGVSPCVYNTLNYTLVLQAGEDDSAQFVPLILSRFQALTVLKLTKINETTTLYQAADDYIKSLDGDTTKEIVIQTAWETASEFRRDSALINTCKEMFNLTDEQVDQMFIDGAKITA